MAPASSPRSSSSSSRWRAKTTATFVFEQEIKGGAVPKEYIPGVQKGLESVMTNGVLAGYPVMGMKATLVDGAFHDVDSSVLAFEIAGRGCCREGLRKGKVRLMEPMMQVDVTTPEDYMGDVIGDINPRRSPWAIWASAATRRRSARPCRLANMFQYVSTLRSISKGRASYSMKLASYDFVPPNVEKLSSWPSSRCRRTRAVPLYVRWFKSCARGWRGLPVLAVLDSESPAASTRSESNGRHCPARRRVPSIEQCHDRRLHFTGPYGSVRS